MYLANSGGGNFTDFATDCFALFIVDYLTDPGYYFDVDPYYFYDGGGAIDLTVPYYAIDFYDCIIDF